MNIKRTTNTASIPVFQGYAKDIQLYQGGFALSNAGIADFTVMKAGTPVVVDEAARTATILKVGVMYANAGSSATAYQILKGSAFAVGDYFSTGAVGGKAFAITSIDNTSSTLFDTVNVGTTIGAATAGDTVYQSTATGATASALPAINGLLYEDTKVVSGVSISAVLRGTVYARRVAYNASIAAALTKIIYSQSK